MKRNIINNGKRSDSNWIGNSTPGSNTYGISSATTRQYIVTQDVQLIPVSAPSIILKSGDTVNAEPNPGDPTKLNVTIEFVASKNSLVPPLFIYNIDTRLLQEVAFDKASIVISSIPPKTFRTN